MTLRQRLAAVLARRLGRRGFEIRRHPAARRQTIFARLDVDLVLDVGAADGGYGRTLRQFGYAGPIVSYEPMPEAFADLSAHIAADPDWTAHQVALGAQAGTADLNIASNRTSSSLLPMLEAHTVAAPHVRYVDRREVEVARLDALAVAPIAAARRPFLKVDTQGFEREVLAGASGVLDDLAGLQLELSFVELYEGGMLIDEAVSWAYRAGFQLVVTEQGYAAPSGEILQMDGIFVRDPSDLY